MLSDYSKTHLDCFFLDQEQKHEPESVCSAQIPARRSVLFWNDMQQSLKINSRSWIRVFFTGKCLDRRRLFEIDVNKFQIGISAHGVLHVMMHKLIQAKERLRPEMILTLWKQINPCGECDHFVVHINLAKMAEQSEAKKQEAKLRVKISNMIFLSFATLKPFSLILRWQFLLKKWPKRSKVQNIFLRWFFKIR